MDLQTIGFQTYPDQYVLVLEHPGAGQRGTRQRVENAEIQVSVVQQLRTH
jgi:hypothetical protein